MSSDARWTRFADRNDAGRRLAAALIGYADGPAPVVLGLPRGGVVVAARVAEALAAPLDVVGVRKVGTPGHAELAMGAIAVWGAEIAVVRNEHVIERAGVGEEAFAAACAGELAVARGRAADWGARRPDVAGRVVIVVDDGLATGATLRAAADAVRAAGPSRLVAAVPVAPPEELPALAHHVDDVVCLHTPFHFGSVGGHYIDFGQAEDEVVVAELARARDRIG